MPTENPDNPHPFSLMDYENFDISFGESDPDGRHPITAMSDIFGEPETISPRALPEDTDFLDALAYLRDRIARPDDAVAFGQALHDFLFPQPVRSLYDQTLGRAGRVRLRLHLHVEQHALNELPWEYCHNGKEFLALNVSKPLVRYIPTDEERSPITAPETLRLLLLLASPSDYQDLDLDSEEANIREALAPLIDSQRLKLDTRRNVTRNSFRRLLQEFDPHILHFAGHGEVTSTGQGAILLQDDQGNPDPVAADDLFVLLRSSQNLKVVLLSACHTAVQGEQRGASRPIRGVAPQLVRAGIPAVIGMQFAIPDRTAVAFMSELYRRLADTEPLDKAVTQARLAARFDPRHEAEQLFWGIPVLFLRAPDGVIWQPRPREVPAPPASVFPSPYRGLEPFKEEHAHLFFGRNEFSDQLVQAVDSQSLVALVGPSGSGKSSVAFAGLLPRLRRQGSWRISHFRPGERPLLALALALLRAASSETETTEPAQDETEQLVDAVALAGKLEDGDLSLAQALAMHQPTGNGTILHDATRVLLLVDQFEELYTRCEDAHERRRFLDLLLAEIEAASAGRPPALVVLLTMRADFLGQALAYRPLADALQGHDLMLGPMTAAELQQAIEQPVAGTGVAFEAGLGARILDDVGQEPGHLALLEFTLDLLWEMVVERRLTHSAYEALGKVEGALARYADNEIRRLVAEDDGENWAAAMRRIFVQLVQLSETATDTRRVVTRAELGDDAWAIIQRLADTRLVVTGRDAQGRQTAELVHEALIRHWGQLQAWIEADRSFRLWQQSLQPSVAQWVASDRSQQALLQADIPLNEAQRWQQERPDELVGEFRAFVAQSLALREWRREEAEIARRRELKQAQRLAEEAEARVLAEEQRVVERDRANWRLRVGAAVLFVAFVTAVVATMFATGAQRDADSSRATAVVVAEIADQNFQHATRNLATADAAQATSQANARLAESGQATAEAAAEAEAQALATAQANRDEAERQQRLAEAEATRAHLNLLEANSLTEANRAFRAYADFNSDAARIFSLRANEVENPSQEAGRVLADFGYGPGTIRLFEHNPDGTGDTKWIWDVAISPDGRTALSAGYDANIIVWEIATGRRLRQLTGHAGIIKSVSYFPDGETAVSAGCAVPNCSRGEAIVWDIDSGQMLQRVATGFGEVRSTVISPAINPDGPRILLGTAEGELLSWHPESGTLVDIMLTVDSELRHDGPINSLQFSPDGARLLSSGCSDWSDGDCSKGLAILWPWPRDTLSSMPPVRLEDEGLRDEIFAAAFSQDGFFIVTGARDATVRVWDSLAAVPITTLVGHNDWVDDVDVHPNGRWIVSVGCQQKVGDDCSKGAVFIWDFLEQRLLFELVGHTDEVQSVSFMPGTGHQILTASRDSTLRFWDISTGGIERLNVGQASAEAVAFSGQSNIIIGGCESFDDGLCQLGEYSIIDDDGTVLSESSIHTDNVLSLALSADGTHLLSGSADGSATLWEIEAGALQEIATISHENEISSVAFVAESNDLFLTGSFDNTVMLWETITEDTAALQQTYEGMNAAVLAITVSPDGNRIVAGGGSPHNDLIEWDRDTRKIVGRYCGGPAELRLGAKNRGEYECAANGEGEREPFNGGHSNWITAAAYSPDGKHLLTGGQDGRVILWNTSNHSAVRQLLDQSDWISSLSFNRGGELALSAATDGTIVIWETDNWVKIHEFWDPSATLGSVDYSLEKDLVVAGTNTSQVYLYRVGQEELLDWVRENRLVRDLTDEEKSTYSVEE